MSHFKKFEKPIKEIIESRVSCRTYQDQWLKEHDKIRLLAFCDSIQEGFKGKKISFRLVEFDKETLKGMKLTYYGLFKNALSFIIGIIAQSDSAYVSFGYAFEHVVLKATELGLGTCWFGDFNPYLVEDIAVTEDQMIPALCVVGYPAERSTIKERIARFAIRASKRKEWRNLFFHENFAEHLTKDSAGKYTVPLEYLRMAPSSRNTQPWRIVKQANPTRFHFFKQTIKAYCEKKRMHEIDLGIAMCHFELGCAEKNINGIWKAYTHNLDDVPAKTTYIMSWEETK
ncbi:MAG: hypothetical protein JSW02_05865 [candidate division WOR-3 bacterium]|nr:MAG: hypothetical protein JSW02_05865 [candidate division WOR-3 bacterium]